MALADRLDPAEAARLCTRAAHTLTDALRSAQFAGERQNTAEVLLALGSRMTPADAQSVIGLAERTLFDAIADSFASSQSFPAGVLGAFGLPASTPDRVRLTAVFMTGTLLPPAPCLPPLVLFHPHLRWREPLRAGQELVDLLKHPFCVGDARRAVLDVLEFTYQRRFRDQWEFVEYAQKHQPQLDLLTPPRRPEPKP